jgi:alkaline phosphatase D
LLNSTPIIGTWDDHDYGINDGNKDFEHKVLAQEIWLDFIGEPKDSLRRKQEGIYTSYSFGPKGQKVKIILIDVRYFRDPRWLPNGDTLGADQWAWLEAELGPANPADLTIIGSGTQILV